MKRLNSGFYNNHESKRNVNILKKKIKKRKSYKVNIWKIVGIKTKFIIKK